jgi:ABC-type nitrate/sulfonate/bicarbonate transport system substrate-binding protein
MRPAWGRLFGLASAAVLSVVGATASAESVRVLVPDEDNLQYLAFWVAEGAGYLKDEGVTISFSIPSAPSQTVDYVKRADSDVAILPPPMYLELIAAHVPIVLFANLLQNDPIDLVVRRSVMAERGITRELPIAERLKRLAGLRIGVAPNPPQRMRALFAAFGMDADRDVQMVILKGPQQNYAFEKGEVDGLYAHTPYLETALVDEGAEMVIDQSGGEVPRLATRQIHALVAMRSYAESHPANVAAITRALARAERLVHADHAATVAAVLRVFPSMDPKKVARIVGIYAPAVPATPRVTVLGLRPALALFPATKKAPDLDGIDLSEYVAPRFADEAAGGAARPWRSWLAGISGALVLLLALGAWTMRPRVAG